MHASSASSACIPRDAPLSVRSEAFAATATASGTPAFEVPPFEVRLPRIRMELGRIVVRLPKVEYHACIRMEGGEPPSVEELTRLIAEAPWTETVTEVTPPKTTVTPGGFRILPESETVRPIRVVCDLGPVELRAAADAFEARLTGCVHEGAKGAGGCGGCAGCGGCGGEGPGAKST